MEGFAWIKLILLSMNLCKNDNGDLKIKICGLTRVDDIIFCSERGIDAVGFLVKENKPDMPTDILLQSEAKRLIKEVPESLTSVLLVKCTEYDQICELIDDVAPDAIQIQGKEVSPETVRLLRTKFENIDIIRTIHTSENDTVDALKQKINLFVDSVDAILLDSKEGGSGKKHNWDTSAQIAEYVKKEGKVFVLAGGLDADNLEKAVRQVKPDIVDIMSGARLIINLPIKGVLDLQKVEELSAIVKKINTNDYDAI